MSLEGNKRLTCWRIAKRIVGFLTKLKHMNTINGEIKYVQLPGASFTHSMFFHLGPKQKPGTLRLLVQGDKAAVLTHCDDDQSGYCLMDDTVIYFPCRKCWGKNGADLESVKELIRYYLINACGYTQVAMDFAEAHRVLDLTRPIGALV